MFKSSTNPATAPTTESVRSRVWAASRVPARLLAVARLSGIGAAIWLVVVIAADATLGFPGVAAYFHALTVGGLILALGAAIVVVPVELRIAFGHADAAPAPAPVDPPVMVPDFAQFVTALADELTVADLDGIVASLKALRKTVKTDAKDLNTRLDGQGSDLQELRRVVDAFVQTVKTNDEHLNKRLDGQGADLQALRGVVDGLGGSSRNTRSSSSRSGGGTSGNARRK